MNEPDRPSRTALYLDFENLVASQYDAVHGRSAWQKDRVVYADAADPQVQAKLAQSRLDVDAIIDYAASRGIVTISRAYANWAAPVFGSYAEDLTARAVDLTQLFPLSGTKNGADIRLATDVIDDLTRFPYLTHVVVAAGDSDYVAVAQKSRRLGRQVIGVGVAGSVGKYWEAACDSFMRYDALPGVELPAWFRRPDHTTAEAQNQANASSDGGSVAAGSGGSGSGGSTAVGSDGTGSGVAGRVGAGQDQRTREAVAEDRADPVPYSKLFRKAMNLIMRNRLDDRVPISELKQVMVRMSPGFDESNMGFSTFSGYVHAQPGVVTDDRNQSVWFAES